MNRSTSPAVYLCAFGLVTCVSLLCLTVAEAVTVREAELRVTQQWVTAKLAGQAVSRRPLSRADVDAIAAAGEELIAQALLPLEDYWHSNEPDIHAAYLFIAAGRPDLAQLWLRWIGDTLYTAAPDGLAGNRQRAIAVRW